MDNLLPADTYTVINQTILTEIDKKTLISLYEPIIGPIAISLYLTLWSDLDNLELISRDYTHHHLMTILKTNLNDILRARQALEAVGLVKTFVNRNENISEYVYELYSPISPYEFFNHPILSILLLNNIGENEYQALLKCYKKNHPSLKDYTEITSSMNETFKAVTPLEAENENIRRQNKLGINLTNLIDFDLIMANIPQGLINAKTFNKKMRELINQLAFIYNIDSVKMSDIIRLSIDDSGIINKDHLREVARRNYEYNNNGSLPTIIYRTQPEYLKTPSGDGSNYAKMIYVFENTKPFDFLKSKNKGITPSSRDLKLLEHLAIDFELPPGVINVLIDYELRVNDLRLNANHIETIATNWARKGIKTVPEAMETAKRVYNRTVKENTPLPKTKTNVKAPSWMNKDNKREDMSAEEIQELEELFKEFR